jgi:hypothetical protein
MPGRSEFGLHLFGSADHFPGTAKYTLDPLRAEGEAALACTDIEDMQWVKLIEVRYFWGGPVGETEIRRADDLFAVLHRRGAEIPTGCRLVQATFRVKFADAKIPRSVSIRPSNIAKYTRDDDGTLVEQWLSRRGFIVAEQAAADE